MVRGQSWRLPMEAGQISLCPRMPLCLSLRVSPPGDLRGYKKGELWHLSSSSRLCFSLLSFPHHPSGWKEWIFLLLPLLYSFFFFFFYLFLAVLGLRFCARAFSSCGKWGPLFIAVRGPLTLVASPVAEHKLQTRRLSICGSRA